MKRYIIIALSFLAWSMFAFGAEVKVENASLARSGDSLKIDFKIVVPQGTVGSDYLQRMVPVVDNQVDSILLEEIEIEGKRK